MASTLDLYIDTSSGKLVEGGSVVGGALPTLTRNDAYTLRLRLLEKKSNGSMDDIDFTGSSLKVGIGNIEEAPSSGSFNLSINGITSSAISYNSTAISIYNAISNNVSTVALYGSSAYGSYLLTATQPNTAMSFNSDPFTLFPTSSVLVSTRRNPATGIQAQQVVKLVRNPIVYADTFSTTPTAGELTLTKLQSGSNTANETYELAVGPLARGGSFALVFGPNSTTAIPLFQSAVSVQASISAGISTVTSNISVQENGKGGYIIGFTGRLGLTNITTSLTLDASGIQFIPMRQTTLTINTAEIADAFADSAASTITPTLEIELTQNGTPKTIYQDTVTIRKDLITVGSTVPGAQASYYTKAQADAAFVSSQNNVGFYGTTPTARPASTTVVSALVNLGLIANTVTLGVAGVPSNVVTDWTGNVSATTRFLADSSAVTSVDWGNRVLKTSSGATAVNWQTGAFGAGATVVTIASNNVSISSGYYIAMGTENGAFRTLSTLASVTFGSVASNDQHYRDVVVTGAAVNDIVLIGLPSAVSAGAVIQGVAYKANTVCLSCSNSDNGTININTATYRITVLDYA
jgi:hypothetical protein